jgi:hypothetical protein
VRSLRVLVDPNAGDDVAAPGPRHGPARDELLRLLDRVAVEPIKSAIAFGKIGLGLDDL